MYLFYCIEGYKIGMLESFKNEEGLQFLKSTDKFHEEVIKMSKDEDFNELIKYTINPNPSKRMSAKELMELEYFRKIREADVNEEEQPELYEVLGKKRKEQEN